MDFLKARRFPTLCPSDVLHVHSLEFAASLEFTAPFEHDIELQRASTMVY